MRRGLRRLGERARGGLETLVERFLWLRRLGRAELVLLFCVLVAGTVSRGLMELVDDVQDGETLRLDEWVVRSLRREDDPATPIGPAWLREVGLDVTALGSYTVVLSIVLAVAIFLLLQRRFRLTALVLAAGLGGTVLTHVTKVLIDRDRPDVVPHLREVVTPGFPSGHATLSAVVYLTLGAILAQAVRGRLSRLYCLTLAAVLALAVGVSRVYLGVHYPTDVLGGWGMGLVWALTCWGTAHYLKERGLLRRGPPAPGETHR